MSINFANKHNKTMKKAFILFALSVFFFAGANAQKEQANWNAANYYAYDTTTFILGAAKGVKSLYADITTLNANDAVMKIGIAPWDGQSAGDLSWTSGTTTADSVILSTTTFAKTIRKSDGTRYTTSRVYFWFPDGIPSDYIGVTITWNSVTSGRIKMGF